MMAMLSSPETSVLTISTRHHIAEDLIACCVVAAGYAHRQQLHVAAVRWQQIARDIRQCYVLCTLCYCPKTGSLVRVRAPYVYDGSSIHLSSCRL
jgi:hypothetical protein